ncbi:kelch-like protein 29 isoform X2 [Tachysurus ichikawai]
MSRHSHRFERDLRPIWERRERSGVSNSCLTANGCGSSAVSATSLANSSNNRPGLLPLPVMPSLLPTPATGANSTCSTELSGKRLASTCSTSTTKVTLIPPTP